MSYQNHECDRSMCQIWFANVKANRSYGLDTKTCQTPYKFDLEVEGQRRTGIKNVRYFEYLYYVYNVHLGEKEPPPPVPTLMVMAAKKGLPVYY